MSQVGFYLFWLNFGQRNAFELIKDFVEIHKVRLFEARILPNAVGFVRTSAFNCRTLRLYPLLLLFFIGIRVQVDQFGDLIVKLCLEQHWFLRLLLLQLAQIKSE